MVMMVAMVMVVMVVIVMAMVIMGFIELIKLQSVVHHQMIPSDQRYGFGNGGDND